MVTNSFGKRNFMQPMERPKHALKVPLLFLLLRLKGRERKDFFSFFPGSQCVHIMFPSSSQWVPIRFSIRSPSSQCVPQHVLHSTSLISHMLWQISSSFHLYTWAKKGKCLFFKIEPSSLGSLHSFMF